LVGLTNQRKFQNFRKPFKPSVLWISEQFLRNYNW